MNFLLRVCEFRMTIGNHLEASGGVGGKKYGQRQSSKVPFRVLQKDAASI
jgi:hypothetical protein